MLPSTSPWAGFRFLFFLLCSLAALWIGGLLWFADDLLGRVEDHATPADAIVVLTGGSERLDTGFALLHQGLGKKLFISGVHPGVGVTDLLRSLQKPWDVPASRIVLGHAAADTAGNAVETAVWMREEGYKSLRLVTASYHMRRSLVEFRRAMPDIQIIPNPVFPGAVKGSEWWRWPGTTQLVFSEYNKFLAASLRQWLESQEDP